MKDLLGNTFVIGNYVTFVDTNGEMKVGKITDISLVDVAVSAPESFDLNVTHNIPFNEALSVYGCNLNDTVATKINMKNEMNPREEPINKELNRKDLYNLIRGTFPNYDIMETYPFTLMGRYIGGFKDKWEWYYDLGESTIKLDLEELWEVYCACEKSLNRRD